MRAEFSSHELDKLFSEVEHFLRDIGEIQLGAEYEKRRLKLERKILLSRKISPPSLPTSPPIRTRDAQPMRKYGIGSMGGAICQGQGRQRSFSYPLVTYHVPLPQVSEEDEEVTADETSRDRTLSRDCSHSRAENDHNSGDPVGHPVGNAAYAQMAQRIEGLRLAYSGVKPPRQRSASVPHVSMPTKGRHYSNRKPNRDYIQLLNCHPNNKVDGEGRIDKEAKPNSKGYNVCWCGGDRDK